jgi:hypothetical protein
MKTPSWPVSVLFNDFVAGNLSSAKQLEYILNWFHRNFEDPANETPYESAEGGYLYIWGGPYDAKDQLWNEFGDLIHEEVLDEATEILEGEGIVDWAPGRDHPDHQRAADERDADGYSNFIPDLDDIVREIEAGTQVRFGGPDELLERKVILERISALEDALEKLQPPHGGIGHNQPPPDNDIAIEKSAEIIEAANSIKTELRKDQPDALAAGRSALILKGILKWAAAKADMAVNVFVTALAGKMGYDAAIDLKGAWAEVLRVIHSIIIAVINWLSSISMPF